MGIIKEFKEFAFKGNILDLAVAVVIGAAFGRIITALVDNIIMPIVGSIIGTSFLALHTNVNGVVITYGAFLQELMNFVIIAFVLFMVIKAINKIHKKKDVIAAGPTTTDILLMEIRDELRKNS